MIVEHLKEMTVINLKYGEDFPELPDGLKKLSVVDCHALTSLPKLPDRLEVLYVLDCPALTSIPELPDGLERLYVLHCKTLTSIPELPDGLEVLHVWDLDLTSLPKLPDGLKLLRVLNCSCLTSLPDLPNGLKVLYAKDCHALNRFPEPPKWLDVLDVPNNLQQQKMRIDDKSKMIDELCHRVKCLVNHTKIRLWSNTLGKKNTIKPYFNSLLDDLLIEIYEDFARAKQDGKDGL